MSEKSMTDKDTILAILELDSDPDDLESCTTRTVVTGPALSTIPRMPT